MIAPVEEIKIENSKNIRLFIKREDTIHPFISGNKYRKLKYNLIEAKRLNKNTLLTFGGAFSNHIAATAYAGKINSLKTIGVIRGEELRNKVDANPTLKFAKANGMTFHFVSRSAYREKSDKDFMKNLKTLFGDFYVIPEGGTNVLAVKGCEEILNAKDDTYDYICNCVGTGGTLSGIINASWEHQTVLGFPVLKGDFITTEILKFVDNKNWRLVTDYHFGGYAKLNQELIGFINDFKRQFGILLDPIYTGKMLFGIIDMIKTNQFLEGSKILAIHSGGLQGIEGMNLKLKSKHWPLIDL